MKAWNVNPNNTIGTLPSVTLNDPIVRTETGLSFQPKQVRASAPDGWHGPYRITIIVTMETLPSGTYTIETGIVLRRWPSAGRLALDLDGLEIGEYWLLAESVSVGNLTVPLREASPITRTEGGVEELLLSYR